MAKLYSGSGDDGTTGLLGEGRVHKFDLRPQAYGAVDEASAAVGLARSLTRSEQISAICEQVQRDLYHLMAELAAVGDAAAQFRTIEADRIAWLEEQMEAVSEHVPLPRDFVIFGAHPSAAALDLARTIVRRAERAVVRLHHEGQLENEHLMAYLNRLSSLCFILALWEDQLCGAENPNLAKTGSI